MLVDLDMHSRLNRLKNDEMRAKVERAERTVRMLNFPVSQLPPIGALQPASAGLAAVSDMLVAPPGETVLPPARQQGGEALPPAAAATRLPSVSQSMAGLVSVPVAVNATPDGGGGVGGSGSGLSSRLLSVVPVGSGHQLQIAHEVRNFPAAINAIAASGDRPSAIEFVCFDHRLLSAAHKEGFQVLSN